MTDTRTITRELQDEILGTARKNQAAVIGAVETWVSGIRSIAPALPEVKLPYAEKLPSPRVLVTGAYDFAEQLLASQRQFADDLLRITVGAPAAQSGPARKGTAGK